MIRNSLFCVGLEGKPTKRTQLFEAHSQRIYPNVPQLRLNTSDEVKTN